MNNQPGVLKWQQLCVPTDSRIYSNRISYLSWSNSTALQSTIHLQNSNVYQCPKLNGQYPNYLIQKLCAAVLKTLDDDDHTRRFFCYFIFSRIINERPFSLLFNPNVFSNRTSKLYSQDDHHKLTRSDSEKICRNMNFRSSS